MCHSICYSALHFWITVANLKKNWRWRGCWRGFFFREQWFFSPKSRDSQLLVMLLRKKLKKKSANRSCHLKPTVLNLQQQPQWSEIESFRKIGWVGGIRFGFVFGCCVCIYVFWVCRRWIVGFVFVFLLMFRFVFVVFVFGWQERSVTGFVFVFVFFLKISLCLCFCISLIRKG